MSANLAVLVVGAGPTGLLLAAELCRRGVPCRVIDAHPTPLHWDRATIVHPRTLEVFESLGIVQTLLETGVKQYMARIHSAGSVLGDIDLSLSGSRYGFNVGISEEVTETILNNYLEQQGGQVVRGAKFITAEEHADGVTATIERNGAQEQLRVNWLVGCGGAHSVTRKLAGIELIGHDTPEPWAVFDATVPTWPYSYECIYGYLDEPLTILTSLPNKRWRVYSRPTGPDSDLVADALTTFRRYLPDASFVDIANPTRFHCHSKYAERYRSGRMLLAGDAAHLCSPSQGHGMNSGIQDAYNLAWKLALVCQGRCAPALLDSYEAERQPVAKMITASGAAFEQAVGLTDPAQRRARDEAIKANFAKPESRHHESVAEAELDIDYSDSPIVTGDKHPALVPGQRIPNTIEVTLSNGKPGLLRELTHRAGHTALVIGGPTANATELEKLANSIRTASNSKLIETTVAVTTPPAAANQLGVSDTTLLVVRPDGHIGLRADRNHAEAIGRYQSILVT
jgi:2-polyprenyl-6-methoxyphenol hydroxylase-like FAD-dependent oxidoreductase